MKLLPRAGAVTILAVSLSISAAAFAQNFWVKKTPAEWSLRECEKLLSDSPWAKNRTVGDVLIEEIGNPASVDGRESHPWIQYTARFWSARPMRQAYVRQVLLARDFAALSPERRQSVEEQNERILGLKFPDRIVLMVVCATNIPSYKRDLAQHWQTRPQSQWTMDTFLITGKGRIPPLGVMAAPGEGAQLELHFPRTIDGQPVVQPGDKSISLEIVHQGVGVLPTERLLFNFKVKDMVLGGEAVF